MTRLVLATGNPGKLREFRQLLADAPALAVEPLSTFTDTQAEETGLTFVENALLKARHAARVSDLPAIADDSGLCVDVLNGEPGVHSARFAGPDATDADNNRRLLDRLAGRPPAQRTARFHCVLVYLQHADDPTPLICEGVWVGRILDTPRGDNGFGYDPLFWVPDENATSAELPPATKNRLSHRGQAMAVLRRHLPR